MRRHLRKSYARHASSPDERREPTQALLEEGARSNGWLGKPHDEEGSGPIVEVRRRRLEWTKARRGEYGGQHVALDGAALVAVG